jgi:hypothetical protein
MSVIHDSEAGDELICIQQFSASPDGEPFSWETSRTFRVGERVRYATFRQNRSLKDNPVCWLVVFDAADGRRYSATQTYFVNEESWQGLKKFFARRVLAEPARRRVHRK